MAFVQPRRWRCLERHPLGAEYPDLSPAARERTAEGLRRHGILNNRKVTLHEGKVLDGWQFLQCCIDADVKPTFQPLPKGITAEEYVEILNDNRRHETQEVAIARAVRRREKVAELAAEGKSTREIAAAVGVSQPTVVRDLQRDSSAADESPPSKNGNGFKLTSPYNLHSWAAAYTAAIRQVRQLAESYGVAGTPLHEDLNKRLAQIDKEFRKLHAQFSKKRKG